MSRRTSPIHGRLLLAPMAGYSDPAFRAICGRYGAALTCTEMISAEGLVRKQRRTLELLATSPLEGPVALQLFGSRVEALAGAAGMVERELDHLISPSFLDLNLGCSVRKVLRTGAGSALLERPEKVGRIIAAMRAATDIPISAKIRLGPGLERANYLEIARTVENAGADMIAVHARYADQGFSGDAHWSAVREICDSVDIPVAGNGDVVDGSSAETMLRETGCDYVMIGRAALGDPHIFTRIEAHLGEGEPVPPIPGREQFMEYYREAKELGLSPSRIKKHSFLYIKGERDARALRAAIARESDPEIIAAVIGDLP